MMRQIIFCTGTSHIRFSGYVRVFTCHFLLNVTVHLAFGCRITGYGVEQRRLRAACRCLSAGTTNRLRHQTSVRQAQY